MKLGNFYIVKCVIAASLIPHSTAQDQSVEPPELTRLRELFRNKIEQEMKPWRERYAKELQRLEDQLVRDRKLSEAVAVKNEKDNYLTANLQPKITTATVPDSVDKAKAAMKGSVWLVYLAEDKSRENLVDTFHFVDDKNVYVFSAKKAFSWSVSSSRKAAVHFLNGDIQIAMDFKIYTATSVYEGKKYTMYLAGKVPKE